MNFDKNMKQISLFFLPKFTKELLWSGTESGNSFSVSYSHCSLFKRNVCPRYNKKRLHNMFDSESCNFLEIFRNQ
jgi:hypothetical protein